MFNTGVTGSVGRTTAEIRAPRSGCETGIMVLIPAGTDTPSADGMVPQDKSIIMIVNKAVTYTAKSLFLFMQKPLLLHTICTHTAEPVLILMIGCYG
jgi:hypothetical protein